MQASPCSEFKFVHIMTPGSAWDHNSKFYIEMHMGICGNAHKNQKDTMSPVKLIYK